MEKLKENIKSAIENLNGQNGRAGRVRMVKMLLSYAIADAEAIESKFVNIDNLVAVQSENTGEGDEYMRGLTNGLILAQATLRNKEAIYVNKTRTDGMALVINQLNRVKNSTSAELLELMAKNTAEASKKAFSSLYEIDQFSINEERLAVVAALIIVQIENLKRP